MIKFSTALREVAQEIEEYALAIAAAESVGLNASEVEWVWSPYAHDAQAAVYDELKEQGNQL